MSKIGTISALDNDYNLMKLKEAADHFPFPEAITNGTTCKGYDMEEGTCLGWYIWKDNGNIAVHRWFNSRGSKFPEHVHEECEWIICYQGKMLITIGNKIHALTPKQGIFLNPQTRHKAYFPSDTWYLTITMPPAKDFPNGARQ